MKDITSSIWFKVFVAVILIAVICVSCAYVISTVQRTDNTSPAEDKLTELREAAAASIVEMHKPAEVNLNGASDWQFEYMHNAKWDVRNRYKPDASESPALIYNACPSLVVDAHGDNVSTLICLRAGMHKARAIGSAVRSNMWDKHNFSGMKSLDKTIFAKFNNEDFDILLCGLKGSPNARIVAFNQYFEDKLRRFNGRMDLAFADMYIDACVLKYVKSELDKEDASDMYKERIAIIAACLADVHYNVRRSLFLQAMKGTEHEYEYDIDLHLIDEFRKLANEDPIGCVKAMATFSKAVNEGSSILP